MIIDAGTAPLLRTDEMEMVRPPGTTRRYTCQEARTVASWYQSSGTYGYAFAALASTGKADTAELLDCIRRTRRMLTPAGPSELDDVLGVPGPSADEDALNELERWVRAQTREVCVDYVTGGREIVGHEEGYVPASRTVWICQCCMLRHANGECCDREHDAEPLSGIPEGWVLALGLPRDEHLEGCAGRERGGECNSGCEHDAFRRYSCWGCDQAVAGDAYAATATEEPTNDEANVQFPECPRCGAALGQAHDPTCRPAEPGDSLSLVVGARYRIVHQSETERYARYSVLVLLEEREQELILDARPVAGTQTMPRSWIREIEPASDATRAVINARWTEER